MRKITILKKDWMELNDFLLITNGRDALVTLDKTKRQATKTVKEPSYAIYHKGKIFNDKDLSTMPPNNNNKEEE